MDLVAEDKDAHLAHVSPVDKDKLAVVYKRNVSRLVSYDIANLPTPRNIGQGRDLHLFKHRFASYSLGARFCRGGCPQWSA